MRRERQCCSVDIGKIASHGEESIPSWRSMAGSAEGRITGKQGERRKRVKFTSG